MAAKASRISAALSTQRVESLNDFKAAAKDFRSSQKASAWKDRANAYAELAFYDDPRVVAVIIKALGKEKNEAVQLAAIRTLAKLQSDAPQQALVLELLTDPVNGRFRQIEFLGQIGAG